MVYLSFIPSLIFKVSERLVAILFYKSTTDYVSDFNCPILLLSARVLVKVFPVSTVEPAKRFTRLTTTDVLAQKTTLATTARFVRLKSSTIKNYILPVALSDLEK